MSDYPTVLREAAGLAQKRKLKGMVVIVLRDNPATRNSDQLLTIEIWKRYYSNLLIKSERTGNYAVVLDRVMDLPREDAISRMRRKIQNDLGLYPPTDWKVAHARGIERHIWEISLGYVPQGY